MDFDSDEHKATVFRARMISFMKRRGDSAAVALHDRYLTYLADFLTLEEIQEKEENLPIVDYRVSKNATKLTFNQFFRLANDPIRLKGFKRHCETCAALRRPLPPPLTAAEMDDLLATTDKHKPKGKPKKKKTKKKVTGDGAAAQPPEVEAAAEPPEVEAAAEPPEVEAEAGSVVTHGGAEAEADSVVTHTAEAEPLNQKYSPIKTSSGDVWNGDNISRYKLNPTLLFSLYSDDIQIDEEGWFSITPEEIAKVQAKVCEGNVIIDGFSGWGGNSIHFANECPLVIAIDIEQKNIEMAQKNAGVYRVAHKIDYILGDFFALPKTLKADIVFLSPPWGGPDYARDFKLDMLKPKTGKELFKAALSISINIVMYLPKRTDRSEVIELANLSSTPLDVVIVESKAERKLKAITVYYSKSIEKKTAGGEVEVTSYFRDKIELLEKAKYRPPHKR